ncbi:MAG: drug/metabolite transporter (DMT)-like permease [Cyclobacteriaceae bacterium]|jgi:drug/metabolite transporter (DMT)-like permease
MSPGEVGALRILAASVFLMPIALQRLRRVPASSVRYLISVGFFGSLLPAFLFAIAQTRVPSSITGVMNAVTPIFTIIVGYLVYQQRYSRRVLLGIAIGFIGTAILITTGNQGGLTFNFYILFIVLATVFYALNLNIIKYHLQDLTALTITSISLLIVGPLAAIYLFGFTPFVSNLSAGSEAFYYSAGYIVLLGVLGTAIAMIIFNNIVRLTDPVFTSSVTYFIPIVAVVWGILDGEFLALMHILGMVFIVAGVYIANRKSKSKD